MTELESWKIDVETNKNAIVEIRKRLAKEPKEMLVGIYYKERRIIFYGPFEKELQIPPSIQGNKITIKIAGKIKDTYYAENMIYYRLSNSIKINEDLDMNTLTIHLEDKVVFLCGFQLIKYMREKIRDRWVYDLTKIIDKKVKLFEEETKRMAEEIERMMLEQKSENTTKQIGLET